VDAGGGGASGGGGTAISGEPGAALLSAIVILGLGSLSNGSSCPSNPAADNDVDNDNEGDGTISLEALFSLLG